MSVERLVTVESDEFNQAFMYVRNFEYEKAFKLFKKLAKSGHLKSQYNLGIMYEYGCWTNQCLKTAAYWYTIAASNGFDPANKKLADIIKKRSSAVYCYVAGITI